MTCAPPEEAEYYWRGMKEQAKKKAVVRKWEEAVATAVTAADRMVGGARATGAAQVVAGAMAAAMTADRVVAQRKEVGARAGAMATAVTAAGRMVEGAMATGAMGAAQVVAGAMATEAMAAD